jgi:hypothetical protein
MMLQLPSGGGIFKPKTPDMSVESFVNDVVASAELPEQDDPVALLETVAEERQVERFLDQVLESDDDPSRLLDHSRL